MPKEHKILLSFNAGELSPLMSARIDFDKREKACRTMENFVPLPHGPARKRSGLRYIAGTKTNTKKSRLVPFRFSTEQAYVLEFGDQYVRFFRDGGQIETLDSDVKLLIHANGNDASQVFTDVSASAHSITANGNVQVDTEFKQFGSGAALFDGTGDSLQIADHADFDLSGGTFTIEMWGRRGDGTCGLPTGTYYSQGTDADNYIRFSSGGFGNLKFEIYAAGTAVVSLNYNFACSGLADFWHIAITEDGNDWYLTLNGAVVDTATDASRAANYGGDIFFGAFDNDVTTTDYLTGSIDEIRVTNGTAQYTAAFVPHTIEFGLSEGGTVYDVTTPYLEEDIFSLRFAQSADVLYIAHEDYAPRKLLRFGDASWRLDTITFLPPPLVIEAVDLATALTLSAKEVGNARTATPGSEVFVTGDVGKEIREVATSGSGRATVVVHNAGPAPDTLDVDIFVEFSGTSLSSGDWELIGTGQTGTLTVSNSIDAPGLEIVLGEIVTLTASLDSFLATDVGKFITTDDGTGVVTYKIISRTNATTVLGAALGYATYSADLVLQAGEWEIKKSIWDSTNGFPNTVTFFENRLLWAGSIGYPQTIWGSAVDDYENHSPGTDDADAYSFTLAGRQVNVIKWMVPGDVLIVGTAGAEWVIGSSGAGTPLTATNVNAKLQTAFGSEDVEPGNVGQTVLFLQKHSRNVREMVFSFDVDRYVAPDMTLLAEHITEGNIIEMDFQNDPYSILWCVRSNFGIDSTSGAIGSTITIPTFAFDSTTKYTASAPEGTTSDDTYLYVTEATGGATKELTIHRFLKSDLSHVDTVVLSDNEYLLARGLYHKDGIIYVTTLIRRTLQGVASRSTTKIFTINTTTFTVTGSKQICIDSGTGDYADCSGTNPDRIYIPQDSRPVVDSDGNIYLPVQESNYAVGWSLDNFGILKVPSDFTTDPTFLDTEPGIALGSLLAINDDYLFIAGDNDKTLDQITLSSFTITDTMELSESAYSIACDNTHVYIIKVSLHEKTLKVEISSFTEVDTLTTTGYTLIYDQYVKALFTTFTGNPQMILTSDFDNVYGSAAGGGTMSGKLLDNTVSDGIYLYDVGFDSGAPAGIRINKYLIGSQDIVDAVDASDAAAVVAATADSDNILLGMTYLRAQEVVAWHRHITDGKFESIAVIPGEKQDDAWFIVNRTIGGAVKRYVELLQPLFDGEVKDAFFVDSGITYDGPAATTISGLDHLEGEAVDVLADGLVVTGHTVSSGDITLTTAAAVVHAGLNYTGVLQPMRLEAGQDEGTAQGRIKRINNMVIRFFETLFGNLGPNSSNLDLMDGKFTAGTLLSGDVEFPFKGDYELGGDIYFTHNKPTPCTVICMIPEVRTSTGQK